MTGTMLLGAYWGPRAANTLGGLCAGDRARDLVQTMVECWEPDWAVLSGDSLRDLQGPKPGEPYVGWATYVSRPSRVWLDLLPAGVSATPIGNGVLITVTMTSAPPRNRWLRRSEPR